MGAKGDEEGVMGGGRGGAKWRDIVGIRFCKEWEVGGKNISRKRVGLKGFLQSWRNLKVFA